MERKFARGVSYLFHPLMFPLYVLMYLLALDSFLSRTLPLSAKATLTGLVFLTTVLSPLFLTWLLVRLRIISSVFMSVKEERIYPIMAITVFYYLTYFLLKGTHISAIFSFFMLGATLLAILTLAMNLFMKVSLHMIGVGSFAGLFLGLALNYGISLNIEILSGIMLAGIIGYSRLESNAHRPAEIYTGFAMGATVMTILFLLV